MKPIISKIKGSYINYLFLTILLVSFLESCGPASSTITVAGVYQTVKSSLDKINNEIIPLLDQKTKQDISLLYSSGDVLLKQVDQDMQLKMNYTFDQLNKTERKIMEDLESIVSQIINKLPSMDQLKEFLGEAQIISYEFINSLPGREKVPMFVYIKNNNYKVGVSESNEISIRGAFLGFKTDYQIKIGNIHITPKMVNNNEILFELPSAFSDTISKPQSLIIKASPSKKLPNLIFLKNRIRHGKEQSIALKLTPVVNYKIVYEIQGKCYMEIRYSETHRQVVVEKDDDPHGWTNIECLSDNSFILNSWGWSQMFPSDNPMALTSCGQSGNCVSVCGDAGVDRAQYQIVMTGRKMQWMNIPVYASDTLTYINQSNIVLPFGPRVDYLTNTDIKGYDMTYRIKIFKQIGKLNPQIEELDSNNSSGAMYHTSFDNNSLILSLSIKNL